MAIFNGKNQDGEGAFFNTVGLGSLANSNGMPLQYQGVSPQAATVSVAASDPTLSRLIGIANSTGRQLFRGTDTNTGQYVYSIGSPPSNANNIIVVNTGESTY